MTIIESAAVRDYHGATIPAAGAYVLDANHRRIGFTARHLMVSKVRGEFTEATATITIGEDPLQSSVTATIQSASFTTGQEQRDGHVKGPDFLDVQTYPTLEFRSTGVSQFDGTSLVLTGDLTIRGVTRPVQLAVELEGVARSPYGQDLFGFSARTEIDREEWGINWNAALETGGVLVSRKITIEIEGEAIRQS